MLTSVLPADVVIWKSRKVAAASGTDAGYQTTPRLETIVQPPAAVRCLPATLIQSWHCVPGRTPVTRVSTWVPQARGA
jgi:hypothetical protein